MTYLFVVLEKSIHLFVLPLEKERPLKTKLWNEDLYCILPDKDDESILVNDLVLEENLHQKNESKQTLNIIIINYKGN